ncbi:hypothetical protein JCM18899A_46890 [Nocardioides sp. AN3]
MTVVSAQYMSDGCCELVDFYGVTTRWSTAVEWADAWLDEWRGDEHGPACEFIGEMIDRAIDGVVAVLTVLAERAAASGEDELGWVGAGPLEDLLSHSGNGATVLGEVERVARHHATFKGALGDVWLGIEVDTEVRSRLVPLGARDLTARGD